MADGGGLPVVVGALSATGGVDTPATPGACEIAEAAPHTKINIPNDFCVAFLFIPPPILGLSPISRVYGFFDGWAIRREVSDYSAHCPTSCPG